jgi:sugar-phosphatase
MGKLLGPYQAFHFDMDGTLLTSRPAIERVWNAYSARWRLDPSGVSNYLHGRRATDAMDHFLPHLDPHQRTCEIEWVESRELQDTEGVVEIPGARDFLNSLPPDRWAIVTSAARRLATCRIKAADLPMPAILLAAEDVRHGKPDPSGYRRAATLLGTSAEQCLVFEDAQAGINAGLAAGADVLVIGDDPGSRALFPKARAASFTKLSAEHRTDGLRLISGQPVKREFQQPDVG